MYLDKNEAEASLISQPAQESLPSEEVRPQDNQGVFQTLSNCFALYERRTLTLIGLHYCNQGGAWMMLTACALYFLEHGVQPERATIYIVAICLPEVF